jgi:hypothetical protein
MSQIIFSNSKSLSKKDIYFTVLLAVGITALVLLLSSLKNFTRDFSWGSTVVICSLMFGIWTIRALREKTLKTVEIDNDSRKVIFVLEKQFAKIEVVSFDITLINYKIRREPDRFIPQKYNLIIQDGKNKLVISSRHKGLSIEALNEINSKLNRYLKQKPSGC